MGLLARLDRKLLPLKRRIAALTEPDITALPYPTYSQRIRDRHSRWFKEGRPHFAASLCGKREGAAYMEKLGYQVPEVYGDFTSINDIPPLHQLPSSFVLKPNGGSSSKDVFLMRDGVNQFDGRRMTREDIIAAVSPTYKGGWTAEELLVHYDGRPGAPLDYKFFCLGARILMIMVIERKSTTHFWKNRCWFRNPDWSRMRTRMRWDLYPEPFAPPKPPCLDEMMRIVTDVGGHLNIFTRIDMYATTRGPVFGEFTSFPGGGRHTTAVTDAWLGSLWQGEEGCGDPPVRARQAEAPMGLTPAA